MPIYVCAEKSEMYRLPGHYDAAGLFFKQDRPEVHRARRRIWSPMFAPGGYVLLLLCRHVHMLMSSV